MKLRNLNFVMCMMALACVAMFSSCQKDKDEDENGNPNLSKFFNISITRCERVGSRIVVEYDLQNKSGKDFSSISLSPASLTDNAGKEYSTYDNIGMRVAGATTRPYEVGPISFAKGETKKLEVVAAGFDPSNTAKSIALTIKGEISGVTLGEKTVRASGPVADNRVLDNGIQTNDAGVAWTVKSYARVDGDLYVAYNMKNNTGSQLKNIEFNEASYMTKGYEFVARDNLAQTYGHLTHAIEGSEKYSPWLSFDLAAGETKTIVTRVPDFDKSGNATTVSICNEMKCDSYLFSDPIVRLINIPIQ